MTPPPELHSNSGFPEGKSWIIAFGDVILLCKMTGGVVTPPYGGPAETFFVTLSLPLPV